MTSIILASLLAVTAAQESVFGPARRFGETDSLAMGLAIEGNRLYAGAGDWLYVFDVSKPLEPRQLGSVAGLGLVRQVAVQNGFAYVTAREGGLWIVDCTDPAAPRIRSRFDTCELATGVDIAGDVCFCGQRQNGVEFIDVSNPDEPRHIAMRKTDESQSVFYRDGWLFSGEWGSGKVTVFDAHDMKAIREVTTVDLYGYGDGIWVDGNYLYAARGHHSLHRTVTGGVMTDEMKRFGGPKVGGGMGHGLDIFELPTLKRVGFVDYPPFYARGLDMWTPRCSGGFLVASQTHNGLFAVDVTDPTAPKVVGRWVHPEPNRPDRPSHCIGSAALGDGVVYVAVRGAGFWLLPCARAKPCVVDRGKLPLNAGYREEYPVEADAWHVWKPHSVGQCRALAVKGDVVYAACGDAGLYVLRATDNGWKELAKMPCHERVYDVSICGDRLYTAEGMEGFGVYDISKGVTDFREAARLRRLPRRRDLDTDQQLALCVTAVNERRVYFSSRCRGGWLYDVTDLSALGQQASCPLQSQALTVRSPARIGGSPGWDKYLEDRSPDGKVIGFNNANTSFVWIDLETGAQTGTKKNRVPLVNGVCAFRDGLSLVSGNGRYALLKPGEVDPEDGSSWTYNQLPLAFPEEGGKGRICGIPRSDGRRVVFTSRIFRRAALYDFSDAAKPKLIRGWKLSGNPDLAVFVGGRVAIPCGYEGVLLEKSKTLTKGDDK